MQQSPSTRSRRALVGIIGALALVLAACGGSGSDTAAETDTAGATDVDVLTVVAPTLAGGEIDLAAEAGNDLLLWFWAPW